MREQTEKQRRMGEYLERLGQYALLMPSLRPFKSKLLRIVSRPRILNANIPENLYYYK